jgi:hypothetical protein
MKKLTSDPRNGLYELRSADASQLLAGALKNRPISEARIQRFAADMRRNAWSENGEPVILDYDGRLLDGQHRMRALTLVDKPVHIYLTFLPSRVQANAFDTMDTGVARTAGDRLHMDDVRYSSTVASIARLCLRLESGPNPFAPGKRLNKNTIAEIRRFYGNHTPALSAVATKIQENATSDPSLPSRGSSASPRALGWSRTIRSASCGSG